MAQRMIVHLIDDTDGTSADQTVHFAIDGVAYEIDLTDAHADSIRRTLAPWINAGRRTGGRRIRNTGSR